MPLTPPTSSYLASDDDLTDAACGIVGRNFSLPCLPATSSQTPTSQRLYGTLVSYRAGQVITNIGIHVQTAGAGAVPTTVKLGVGSLATNKALAVTGNVAASAQWTAAGIGMRVVALTAPYTIPLDGSYWHYWLTDGTWGVTQMVFLRGSSMGSGGVINGAGQLIQGALDGQTDIVVGTTYTLASANGISPLFLTT